MHGFVYNITFSLNAVWLITVYIILNIIDYILTKKVIKLGGKEWWFLHRLVGSLIPKVVYTVIATIIFIWKLELSLWLWLDIFLIVVCIWNTTQYIRQRRFSKK